MMFDSLNPRCGITGDLCKNPSLDCEKCSIAAKLDEQKFDKIKTLKEKIAKLEEKIAKLEEKQLRKEKYESEAAVDVKKIMKYWRDEE